MAESTYNAFVSFFGDKTAGNPITGSSLILTGNISKDMFENQVPETLEGRIFISLAYVAAMIPGSTIVKDFEKIEDLVVTARFPRGFQPKMNQAGDALERGDESLNGNAPTFLTQRDNPDNFGDYSNENAANCPDAESRSLLSVVAGGHNTWKTWFIDLLGASQVVSLTSTHVKSYCAWRDSPTVDGSYVSSNFSKLKGGMPMVTSNDELRGLLSDGEWIKYRTTFATTTGLLNKMVNECPKDYLTVFSPATMKAIKDADSEYWSEKAYRKIPTKALGILYAYLSATEQLVGGLWGAKRAYDELALGEKESLDNWFKEAKSKLTVFKGGVLAGKLPSSLVGV